MNTPRYPADGTSPVAYDAKAVAGHPAELVARNRRGLRVARIVLERGIDLEESQSDRPMPPVPGEPSRGPALPKMRPNE